MVREDRPARGARHRGGGKRRREVRAEAVREHVLRVDAQHPGLVHQPPAVVGASHSRLVRRPRQRPRGAQRSGSEGAGRLGGGRGAAPGRRRAGHLVFVRPVDLRHARLAGEDAGARRLPSHQRAGDGLRHHLLLGGADDHDDLALHRRSAVSRGLHPRHGARCRGREDVQDARQRPRSAGHRRRHFDGRAGRQAHRQHDAAAACRADRRTHPPRISERHPSLRHGRAPLRVLRLGLPRAGSRLRSEAHRRLSELLQQAVERGEVRALARGGAFGGLAARRRGRGGRGRALDPFPHCTPRYHGPRSHRQLSLRPLRERRLRVRVARILRLVRGVRQGHAVRQGRVRGTPGRGAPHAGGDVGDAASHRPPDRSLRDGNAVAVAAGNGSRQWRNDHAAAVSERGGRRVRCGRGSGGGLGEGRRGCGAQHSR